MRIGLVCPDVPGHLNPLCTLGGELARRGHDIAVFGSRTAHSVCQRESLPLVCLGEGGELAAQLEQSFDRLGHCGTVEGMLQTGKMFGISARLVLRHLPSALDSGDFEGLLIDQVSPAACVVAEQQGVPYVIVCNALALHPDRRMPPPALTWNFRDDAVGRLRNRAANAVLRRLYCWLSGQRSTGVNPLMLVSDSDRGLTRLAQQPEFFDFPRITLAPRFHYTGPWHRRDRDDLTIDFPWQWLDDRPLIYASMGTLQNRLTGVFESILGCAAGLDVQVVLSKGGGNVQLSVDPPPNVLVLDRAPQLRLLEKASLAITHAGLNTALECLSCGVPMLCLPVTNDQPGVAKRVEWLGAGRVLPVSRVSAKRLAKELSELMSRAGYRHAAQQCAHKIRDARGLDQAADLIEQAFRGKDQPAGPVGANGTSNRAKIRARSDSPKRVRVN